MLRDKFNALRLAPWLATLATLLAAASLRAQASGSPRVFSIGQPPLWTFHATALAPVHAATQQWSPWLVFGVHHALINPVTGLFGATAEAYVAPGGHETGLRALAASNALALSAGVDWSFAHRRVSPIISYQSAIRRGGLFGHGSMLRVDWLPTRSQTLAIGVTVPLFRPLAGRTRPHETHVDLRTIAGAGRPTSRSTTVPAVDDEGLRSAASVVAAFSNAYSSRAAALIAHSPDGYATAWRRYDGATHRVFRDRGLDSITASRLVARARTEALERVVLPIDSLFGQAKANPRDLSPLTSNASARFARWLADSAKLSADEQSRAASAFDSWLSAIAGVYDEIMSDAKDSRLAWLPIDLALPPSQFDDQARVDSLIARVVGHPFSDQNALTYLRSTDLPLEIARSIYATRIYHVLWTHDFTGRRQSGAIDNVAYSMVADAYFPALTAAVKRYDSTGVFPTYIILQDEFFYEPRDNRLWMNILEDPLHATIHLPGDTTDRAAHLRDRQAELRAAVAASRRLQREAAASGDADRWLRSTVKVHVNIMEPYDFSFRSRQIIRGIPFTPDNIMRDHRKLVFYDLDEANPYRGALMIMGVGIGEHYASATWEDRGYRMRGPATLEARRAVREALLRNGFTEAEIPAPLRAVASASGAEQRANTYAYVGRALQVHNQAGFGRKESSVARAMLYNLAPSGSVIIVPDPMWLSDTWAGMLAGAAARGCRVYIIAPSDANAPSPQAPLMSVQHDVLSRVLALSKALGPEIRSSGGDLRVGIFAAHANVDDAAGRAREVREGLARAPWILKLIPFDAKTLSVLQNAERVVATAPNATDIAHDEKPRAPQLHSKAQLIARPGAIAALVHQAGWDSVLAQSIRGQAEATARFAEQLGYTNPDVDTTATRSTDALVRAYERSLSEAERRRVSFYFSVGSQNQDPRGIVSDAEATVIVSGVQASAGLVDSFYLMARSTWVTTDQALEAFNPSHPGLMSRVAWWIRSTF